MTEFRQFLQAVCPTCGVQTVLSIAVGDQISLSKIMCPVCQTELHSNRIEVQAPSGEARAGYWCPAAGKLLPEPCQHWHGGPDEPEKPL